MNLPSIKEQVERDRQRLKERQEADQKRLKNEMKKDYKKIQEEQKRLKNEMKKDYEKLKQKQKRNNFKREKNIKLAKSTIYIDSSSYTNISGVGLGFIGAGTLAGISTSSMLGGIGLVGQFGGIGLGIGTMTGTGAMIGAATYGAFTAIKESDVTVLGAIGLGTMGGAGFSASVGGMGLSVGGTAFGIGMGSMAVAGGIVGLGIYGLTKIVTNASKTSKIYRNLDYLETITREYEEERKWRDLESGYLGIEAELQALKASL